MHYDFWLKLTILYISFFAVYTLGKQTTIALIIKF